MNQAKENEHWHWLVWWWKLTWPITPAKWSQHSYCMVLTTLSHSRLKTSFHLSFPAESFPMHQVCLSDLPSSFGLGYGHFFLRRDLNFFLKHGIKFLSLPTSSTISRRSVEIPEQSSSSAKVLDSRDKEEQVPGTESMVMLWGGLFQIHATCENPNMMPHLLLYQHTHHRYCLNALGTPSKPREKGPIESVKVKSKLILHRDVLWYLLSENPSVFVDES